MYGWVKVIIWHCIGSNAPSMFFGRIPGSKIKMKVKSKKGGGGRRENLNLRVSMHCQISPVDLLKNTIAHRSVQISLWLTSGSQAGEIRDNCLDLCCSFRIYLSWILSYLDLVMGDQQGSD